MKPLLSARAAQANDRHTIDVVGIQERELINRVAQSVLDTLKSEGYDLSAPCILCGSGNNGADGLALACLLKDSGYNPTVVYLGKLYAVAPLPKKKKGVPAESSPIDPEKIGTPDIQAMSAQCQAYYEQTCRQGIEILTDKMPATVSVFVDAIFGIGLHGAPDKGLCEIIQMINQSDAPVLSIDIPSGIYADSGEVAEQAIRATQTVTVQSLKAGLQLYPGAEFAGKITVADVGIEQDPTFNEPEILALEDQDIPAMLPTRPARSYKGTFGRVLVVCGCPGMAGAAYMAAMAAYRAGAGLVEILTHAQNRVILQQLIPEAVVTAYWGKKRLTKTVKAAVARADSIVIGCGMGKGAVAKQIVKTVLKCAKVPCVVDADALNLIAAKPGMLTGVSKKQKPYVLITPHAAEAARLLGGKAKTATVLSNVARTAQELCTKYKVNVLLKDTHSLVCAHDHSLRYVNLSGSTALATAGSGDVLAGLIGGLAAAVTNEQPLCTTAALGAYLHGKAGEHAEHAVGAQAAMAREILDGLTTQI